jgi:hypothetical protein
MPPSIGNKSRLRRGNFTLHIRRQTVLGNKIEYLRHQGSKKRPIEAGAKALLTFFV